jgi:antirestriction protein ArdC
MDLNLGSDLPNLIYQLSLGSSPGVFPYWRFKMKSTDIYQHITRQIVTLMEQQGSDWTRPWTSATGGPSNFLTGDHYRGINALLLGLRAYDSGYDSHQWATFKQWRMKGGHVRQGEKGTLCVFFKRTPVEKDGEQQIIPVLNHFFLFNLYQVDGVEAPAAVPLPEVERNAKVDTFISSTGAVIHEKGHRAFYSPETDMIWIPELGAFTNQELFYSTLLHELAHWSGHGSRLDRREGTRSRFGDEAYAMEELVAELASAFLSIQLQVSHEPREDHAKYLNDLLGFQTAEAKAA